MSHFYALEDNNVRFLPDVHTPAQARKTPGIVCSSVTTKLAIAPNPFLDNWGKEQLVKYARQYPDKHYAVIKNMMYGFRIDVDGTRVTSAQFGTSVHKALEDALNVSTRGEYTPDESPYSLFVNPFMQWFADEDMQILATEQMVGDEKRLVAGTIDVVARNCAGQVVLLDFKTRDCKGKNPGEKTYEKDLLQLAVEADIVKNIHGLSYTPRIASVVIDASTGNTAVKWWTVKAQAKGEFLFDAINTFYNAFILRI